MYSQLFFIIITLLIINLSPPSSQSGSTSIITFLQGFTLYVVTLIIVIAETVLLSKHRRFLNLLNSLVNFEICFCILFIITLFPLWSTSSYFLYSFSYVLLYFIGLSIYYFFSSSEHDALALSYTIRQLRFYFPFVVPFLLLNAFYDLLKVLPFPLLHKFFMGNAENIWEFLFLLSGTIVILFFLIGFFPPILLRFWGCKNITNTEIKKRLDNICTKANFSHGGMKIWSIMKDSYTAAIIGIFPRLRFVMFTGKLLKNSPPDYVEAILCHEIGHSQKKHLYIYPFILFGMMLTGGLLTFFIGEGLLNYVALKKAVGSSFIWNVLEPIVLFVPYVILLALYFRYIFGYFSRNFERQADLHVYQVGVSPDHMIGALDYIGVLSGNSHKKPSWHHYSIWQRMEFLKSTIRDPNLIKKHHRKVSRILKIYLFILVVFGLLFSSVYLPKAPVFSKVNAFFMSSSKSFNDFLTDDLREELIDKYTSSYSFFKKDKISETIVEKSLEHPGALSSSGLFSFYAAQYLYQINQEKNSLLMMTEAWKKTDFNKYPPSVQKKFIEVSKYLLSKTKRAPFQEARQKLIYSLKDKVQSYQYDPYYGDETAHNLILEVIL